MLTLGGIRPLYGLISLTLVRSVHLVNRVDPWWDPSTSWTCKFDPGWVRPLCGLISLTLGGIRPLYGLVSLTLVGSVHFVNRGVDPS